MTKAEFKKLSCDIRTCARNMATARGISTRAELHNMCWWRDNYRTDKYGDHIYCKYLCVGDYDVGLVWKKI